MTRSFWSCAVGEMLELSSSECRALLRSGGVGRVALSTPNGPHILPVNYSVLDDSIILRTSPYSLLGTYGRDTTLAFEIDGFDSSQQQGWSVVVRGRAQAVTDRLELDLIREAAPQPWAGGPRPLHLRLRWAELGGRRVVGRWEPSPGLPMDSFG